jgi:tetratricopeptide (TPR) repeat protein
VCPSAGPANQRAGVDISGTVGSVGGDIVGGNKGLDEEQLVNVLGRKGVLEQAELAGLQRRVIVGLARSLKRDVSDFDQAVTELERAVEVALDVVARGERGTSADEFVDKVLSEIAEKTRCEDFDGGAREVDAALVELDRREAEQRDATRRARVTLLEAGVRQDILRRDAVGAAGRIETLVAVDHPTDRPAWLPEFSERYEAFREDGETNGVNFSLSVAIELARRMLATAQDADERGIAANCAGRALSKLGERNSGTERLEEAVAAYRAALEAWTREREPLRWATTQNNLGVALVGLGERERGTARLEEAVAAYRAALEEGTRERVPLDWAMTQNNLAVALVGLGERESETARLEEAVAACRAALEEWTRERAPLDWARTQNNLGNALSLLGTRESGTARLEEAVVAYRAGLEEETRERVPLDWATMQSNLGDALSLLGARESGTVRLEEAVIAYRAALEERTRERVPLDWARTMGNQGVALMRLAERLSDVGMARAAVRQIDMALKTMRDAGHASFAAYYKARLPEARAVIDRLGKDPRVTIEGPADR